LRRVKRSPGKLAIATSGAAWPIDTLDEAEMTQRICWSWRSHTQQLVHAEIELRGRTPKGLALGTQPLELAKRVQLAIAVRRFSHENRMRTLGRGVKPLRAVGPSRSGEKEPYYRAWLSVRVSCRGGR
jgi:hypothetical protein